MNVGICSFPICPILIYQFGEQMAYNLIGGFFLSIFLRIVGRRSTVL
jgi:hypothetical protein